MRRSRAILLTLTWVAALAAACATAPSKFYTLDSTATAEGAAGTYTVGVGPVSIPASVDRPQVVVQSAPNRVQFDEFNRWAAPLGDSIARVVAGNLTVLLGTPRVAITPLGNFAPDYQVTMNVQRFESMPGESVTIDTVWAVHRAGSGTTRTGRTLAHEAAPGEGLEAVAAAHSRALATLSGDIASAIRTEADTAR